MLRAPYRRRHEQQAQQCRTFSRPIQIELLVVRVSAIADRAEAI